MVGQIGADAWRRRPTTLNTIVSVKRFMGRTLADMADAGKLPYRFVDRRACWPSRRVEGVKSRPSRSRPRSWRLCAFRAEDSFDDELFGAVITVPAYFDDAQRQATKDAAELAG